MIEELREAIVTVAEGISGWTDTVFYEEVPRNQALPYRRFSVTAYPLTPDTGGEFEQVYVQFDIFGAAISDVQDGIAALRSAFAPGHGITLTGYDTVQVTPIRIVSPVRDGDAKDRNRPWRTTIEFKFQMYKPRT